jgi:predicted phosphodiesterase
MRIFTVSDIHVDYEENDLWINSLSNIDYVNDTLILAGDISDSISLIGKCFEQLARKFKTVFYVPGNHDIWVRGASQTEVNSIDKFFQLLTIGRECGVVTEPKSLNNLRVIPLYSWYDLSFGKLSDELLAKWMDFSHCRWPETLKTPTAQNRFFLQKNNLQETPVDQTVITFSHFLPRIDVMPGYIPHKFRDIYPVLGSPLLDQQIRALDSKIHIYGHSHVNRKLTLEGVQYINNAFGYPSETRISSKRLLEITYR